MWKHIALEANGLHHSRSQDACQIAVEGEYLIMAVADGAGSAVYGQMGAKLAAFDLMRQAKRIILDQSHTSRDLEVQMRGAFHAAKKTIKQAAKRRKCNIGDLATTAILAIAAPSMLIAGHVGDGGVVGRIEDGDYFTASAPERARFSHHTYFVTDTDYEQHLRFSVIRRHFDAVVVFTDGVQDQVLSDAGVNHNFVSPFIRDLQEMPSHQAAFTLNDYLQDLKAVTDDDITIALACKGKST